MTLFGSTTLLERRSHVDAMRNGLVAVTNWGTDVHMRLVRLKPFEFNRYNQPVPVYNCKNVPYYL